MQHDIPVSCSVNFGGIENENYHHRNVLQTADPEQYLSQSAHCCSLPMLNLSRATYVREAHTQANSAAGTMIASAATTLNLVLSHRYAPAVIQNKSSDIPVWPTQ